MLITCARVLVRSRDANPACTGRRTAVFDGAILRLLRYFVTFTVSVTPMPADCRQGWSGPTGMGRRAVGADHLGKKNPPLEGGGWYA